MSDEPSEVIARHRDELLGIEGVSAVAWGLSPTVAGRACILVYALPGTPVPESVEGIPVELVPTEGFAAY